MINDIFSEQDAARILRIPRSICIKDDMWFWLDDEKGCYTVKSGYKRLTWAFTPSTTDQVEFNWQRLWILLIPLKVKNLIWRVYHNCLPTLDNLRKKHVEVDPQCPVCRTEEKSLDHIIWTCNFARQCWEESALSIQHLDGQPTIHILKTALATWKDTEVEVLCMVIWGLWNHRKQ